jgi:TPR repeat protein
MAGDERSRAGWAVVAALACLAAAAGVQYDRDRRTPPATHDEAILYVPSADAVKRLALGYDDVLADLYWIRAVQWFGGHTLAERARLQRDLLYPLLDITTTLDPHFNMAYRFGAIFLAEGAPKPGNPDLAIALLEKAMRAMPERWQYPYDVAFVHYWWRHDYEAAARWFQKASRLKGAPEWLPGLAATTLTQGGQRSASRFLWRRILDEAEQEYMRNTASHRLVQLDVLDELDKLNGAMDHVTATTGERPRTWEPLRRAGWLRRVPPVDPSGEPYVIDERTGRATVSRASRYHPLPDEMPAEPRSPGGAKTVTP